MTATVVAGAAGFCVGFVLGLVVGKSAPLAWQDAAGFHLGEQERATSEGDELAQHGIGSAGPTLKEGGHRGERDYEG